MQNKPNFLDTQVNVTSLLTKYYEKNRLSRRGENKPNQTQPVVSLSNLFQTLHLLSDALVLKNPSNLHHVNDRNSSTNSIVYLPGLPGPMVLASNLTTGTISLVVTAMKSSSALRAWWGVNDFSTTSNPIFLAALIANLRVIEGRILAVRGAVCSVCVNTAKKADPAPSVIKPASSTSMASSQPFLAASARARTLGNRFSDFMSHLFHRESGWVDTAMPSVFASLPSGNSAAVLKNLGSRSSS